MRVYNGKSSQVDLPQTEDSRLVIGPKSVSGEFLPNEDFLLMIAKNFSEEDLALIVSGPFEINMCGHNPACASMVVDSLDKAIARFAVKKEKTDDYCLNTKSSSEKEQLHITKVEEKPIDRVVSGKNKKQK